MLNRSLYIFSSKMVGYAVRIVLPYFLVRLMSMGDFGAYRQFFLLDAYAKLLFQLGVNQALYYFIPRDEENAGAYFVNCVALNIAVFLVAYAAIGIFKEQLSGWLNMKILLEVFWSLAAYSSIRMLTVSCDSYLNARRRVKASAFFEIASQVLVSGLTVFAAAYWKDLGHIILCLVIGRGVQLLAMMSYIHWRMHGFRARRYFFGVWGQVRYGIVLGFSGVLWGLQTRLHEFFVSRYFGVDGYAVYSVGCTQIPVMQMFTQSLGVVVLGQFALLEKDGDWDGIRRLWKRLLTSLYATAIPTVLVLVLVAKPLILFMFTDKYAGAVPIFQLNSLIKLNYIFNAIFVLRAMDRNDIAVWVNLVALAATPVALHLGMRYGGTSGIIGAQFVLIMGRSIIQQVILNRISDARLAYFVSPRAVWDFYVEVWLKGRAMVVRRLRGNGLGHAGRGGE